MRENNIQNAEITLEKTQRIPNTVAALQIHSIQLQHKARTRLPPPPPEKELENPDPRDSGE